LEQGLTPLALCVEQTWDEKPKGGDELHRNAIGRQQAGDKKMEAMATYQNETFKPDLLLCVSWWAIKAHSLEGTIPPGNGGPQAGKNRSQSPISMQYQLVSHLGLEDARAPSSKEQGRKT